MSSSNDPTSNDEHRPVWDQMYEMWEDGLIPSNDASDADIQDIMMGLETESSVREVRHIIRRLNAMGPPPPRPTRISPTHRTSAFNTPTRRSNTNPFSPTSPTVRRKRRANSSTSLGFTSISEQNAALRTEGRRLESALESSQQAVEHLQAKNERFADQLQAYVENLIETEDALAEARNARDVLSDQVQASSDSAATFARSTTILQNNHDEAMKKQEAKVKEAEENVRKARGAQMKAEQDLLQAEEEQRKAMEEQKRLREELERVRRELKEQREENVQLGNENKRIKLTYDNGKDELTAKLEKAQNEIAAFDQSIAAKDQDIAAKDVEIAAKDQDIAARDQTIAARDQAIVARDQELANRQLLIDNLQQQLNNRPARRRGGRATAGGGRVSTAEVNRLTNEAAPVFGVEVPVVTDAQGNVVGHGVATLPAMPRLRSAARNNDESDHEDDDGDAQ
ncbi:hypothetical protein BJ508DRAFT_336940 [Ascobolus immersus RN42]|uniref:Uncharacterized protein n=1 Tax=Ascobolus immersus RN42 TaxID=1160509 RepID=A0A3N4H6T7_ASCIM|nr:hypothetical protein BJ508DRAFT_336940 [Ascobolus immersus RN42]